MKFINRNQLVSSYKRRFKSTIGFIGLGQMGFPMATNLTKKTSAQEIIVFDTNPAILSKFIQESSNSQSFNSNLKKVTIASHPSEVASKASVIITMLPESKHVKTVYTAGNGILSTVLPDTLLIDSSTIDVDTAKHMNKLAAEKNVIALDAPVSGGVGGATAGTLTFMVGAPSETVFNQAKPILSNMGKNIVYCGGNGNGQVVKIANNMLLGISMIAASEAMNLGVRLGMDPKLLASIINTSSGRCWSTDTYNPCPGVIPNVPSSRDYEGGFGVPLMAKDLGLAVHAASSSKSTVMLGSLAHQIYQQLSASPDFSKKDFSSVFKWLNESAQNKGN